MDGATRRALFGTDEPVDEVRVLRAGALTLRLRGTRVLDICAGQHEVWHGIAFLYRDPDWGTPEPVLDRIALEQGDDRFRAQLWAHVPTAPAIDLRLLIEGHADGRVRYTGTAVPRGDIATHRTGLCLLHPQSAAGHGIVVQHADGRQSASTFPSLIAPWPPFMGVQGIRHEYVPGAWAQARFEGDMFELEDQRNNADASYKTYNRSNMMPRPYRLQAGLAVTQSVELWLLDPPPPAAQASPLQAAKTPCQPSGFPSIGLAIGAADAAEPQSLCPALQALQPPQLHLVLERPDEAVDWSGVASLLAAARASLRLDVDRIDEANAGAALAALAGRLGAHGISPESVAVFPSTVRIVTAARQAFPGSAIGGGTPYFFTQLNRAEQLGAVDFLSCTTSALVHGADDESVMLGLASLPAMARTMASRHPGLPLRIGPAGIAARRSPLGGQPDADGRRRLALAQRDPRSPALFGAAWLLGYLAQWASSGVPAISLLDGFVRQSGPSPAADAALPTPAFFVLQGLRGARRLLQAGLQEQGRLAVLAFTSDTCAMTLVANLAAQDTSVASLQALAPGLSDPERVSMMDAGSWLAFVAGRSTSPWRELQGPASGRLDLPPLAIALCSARTGAQPMSMEQGEHPEGSMPAGSKASPRMQSTRACSSHAS